MEHNVIQIQILVVGLLLTSACIWGHIARKIHLGEIVGQIFGGIMVGPSFIELVVTSLSKYEFIVNSSFFRSVNHLYENYFPSYKGIFDSYHFFVFLFLGLIAFSLGEELHIDKLKEVGLKAPIICVIQAALTWAFLTFGFYYIFDFELIHALIIGSIGIATAPAMTFILVSKLKISGQLKTVLANVLVLDDILEVIFFSIFLGAAVVMSQGGEVSIYKIFKSVSLELISAFMLGIVVFALLKNTLKKRISTEEDVDVPETFLSMILSDHPTQSVEVLLMIVGLVSIGISVAISFHIPFLITAVVAGFFISNYHSHQLFDSLKIDNVMDIFNLSFFGIIGASINLNSFSYKTTYFVLGYIILRLIGKLFGTWIGCKITKQSKDITKFLPPLMLPQAGMAAVEAMLVATTLKGFGGMKIFNIIIPAVVIFEIVGAFISEKTLLRWKRRVLR